MRRSTLLQRNLTYHWRTNAAVISGVATAVAVLAGALLVGDSVRGSLRELVLGRIGKTDVVVAATNPFRAALARQMGEGAYAMFAMEGIVAHGANKRSASKVAIYGVDDGFWRFHGIALTKDAPAGRNTLVSAPLAEELHIQPGDPIVIRLDKPSEIPAESLHGRKEDSVKAVRLAAAHVLTSQELGEFSLKPAQAGVRAVFIALSRLQRELAQNGRANVMLLRGAGAVEQRFMEQATLADYGIRLKPVAGGRQLSVETTSMVVSDALAAATEEAAKEVGARTSPVLTYIVNSIRFEGREVPYSLVAALDLAPFGVKDGLVVNDWTARELGLKPGANVSMDYFVWRTEGVLATEKTEAVVAAVTPIGGPAGDRDYAPEYPGITEARTIHDWDPPFPMELNKIRKQDEDYWDRYRTTPKAFLSIEQGKKLWGTRYGSLTSIRVEPAGRRAEFEAALRKRLRPAAMDIAIVPLRQESLSASEGSTDFGQYFLYFSFFLVVSALLLVSLFFKLGVEQRYREAGLLRAVGFPVAQIGNLFLAEGAILAAIGALLGSIAAAAYAALILYGLRTWWVDAVGTRLLRLHIGAPSLIGGAIGGLLTAAIVVYFATRALGKPSPRALLHGGIDATSATTKTRARIVAVAFALIGIAMLAAAAMGQMPAAGGFFGAGAMLLIAALAAQRLWLASGIAETNSIVRLGLRNATYRPGRSVLSTSLIAFATFLIVSLTAFRQEGASQDPAQRPGTGGYALVGESVLPVIHNPGVPAGRQELGFSSDAESLFQGVSVTPLRLRPGDDSSCLNLYQPRNPRVLGVPDDVLFRMPLSKEKIAPKPGEIAAYVDANSLQYVLHKKQGDEIVLQPESGAPVRLRISATIADSMFQSEILIRDADFLRAFPEQQGFRMFLVQAPPAKTGPVIETMEDRLQDYGLDLVSTVDRLNEYHRVENAYLSTFQSLGGLGLLLGTVGLAAVLLRNVLERRKELALLRAVGYRPAAIGNLILAENVLLLASGLLIGTLCAALAIAPALAERAGKLPLGSILLMLGAVAVTGFASSALAVRAAARSPLLASLRSE
ncbi:MAG: ABC transporter permease [Bryobacterales bacterium]|nr:ABC transporter permease [Bryobacterales bacterium]